MIASTSLSIIPDSLVKEPVVIVIDDTTIVKIGKNSQVCSTCMIIQFTIQKTHRQWSLFCEPYNVCSGNIIMEFLAAMAGVSRTLCKTV